jgi:hypothetical protein
MLEKSIELVGPALLGTYSWAVYITSAPTCLDVQHSLVVSAYIFVVQRVFCQWQ